MDTYTVKQTALALGVTDKRVRQLLEEGKLKAVTSKPVTIDQLEVLKLRNEREQSVRVIKARGKRANAAQDLLASMKLLVEQVEKSNQRQIEAIQSASERVEETYRQQVAELRQENERLKSQLIESLSKRRRFFKKS
jgi:DNA-binding protein